MSTEKEAIPAEYQPKIQSYSIKLGLSEDALKEELESFYTQSSNWKTSWSRLNSKYRTKFGMTRITGSVTFQGFFIGAQDPKDFIQMMKDKAMRIYKQNQTLAFNGDAKGPFVTQLDDQSIVPVDRREKVKGKLNPRIGQPFDPAEHSWERLLFGTATRMTDGAKGFFSLRFRDEMALKVQYTIHEPITFKATVSKSQPYFMLNGSKNSEIKPLTGVTYDIEKEIKQTCTLIHPREAPVFYEKHKDDYETFMSEGVVDWIDPDSLERDRRLIALGEDDMDLEEEALIVRIPSHIPLDFGEGTRAIVIGSLFRTSDRDERKGRIEMDCYGIYPIPSTRTDFKANNPDIPAVTWQMGQEENG